jgi:uncharacterized protein involved in exopolysaccharide biosynthesis
VTATNDNRDTEAAKIDDLMAALRRRLPLIFAVCLLFAGGMTALAFYMTPVYRGSAILAPAHSEKNALGSGLGAALGSVGGVAALAGIGLSSDASATDEAIAVLRSQQLTERFIRENNLMPELFPSLWDASSGRWKEGIKKIPTLARGFRVFDGARKIERDLKTGLITLRIDWQDRVKAADWTNRYVQLLNDEMRARAISDAEASLGYLQKEFANTVDVSTREAISKLIESQVKQKMLAHVTQEYALRVIDKAEVADADSPVRPIKILYIFLGLVFGAILGIIVALMLYKRELSKRELSYRIA